MRSAPRREDDLTTTARIRDAAITYFGEHGFRKTTIRAIAAKAEVSPALVIHHFGSKDGLRQACDDHITQLIDAEVAQAASQMAPADMLAMIARRPDYIYVAPYLVTALIEGGDFAEKLFVRLVDDMESYLRAAVETGIARPTEGDERSRAEMVTLFKLGFLVFPQYVVPKSTPPGSRLLLAADRLAIPAMELFTYGFYATSDYLDAFRAQQAASTRARPSEQRAQRDSHTPTPGFAAPTPNGGRAHHPTRPEGEPA
jgi:AcrR family transcriptional regulator